VSDELLTEIDGPIARIIFNRPDVRNAVNQEMMAKMNEFVKLVEHDPNIRCIILTGAGDHFMAGADVNNFSEPLKQSEQERRINFEKRVQTASQLFHSMRRLPQPVISRIRGAVAGAAIGWVAGSDFVIASDNALFVLAHVHIGTSPDGASTYYLPRVVGLRKSIAMGMLGERLSAEDAEKCGLVTRVVPDADLDKETEKLAKKLVNSPRHVLKRVKMMMNQSLDNTLAEQLQLEAESFADCTSKPDFIEGVNAFIEKRKPEFNKE